MKVIPFEPGRIVVSKQGHDTGDWLVITGVVDDKHVLIADGKHRKLEKPKKKQTKHLRAKPILDEGIRQTLEEGKPLLDSDIRKAIAAALEYCTTNMGMNKTKQKEECALVQERCH